MNTYLKNTNEKSMQNEDGENDFSYKSVQFHTEIDLPGTKFLSVEIYFLTFFLNEKQKILIF